jgi:hypothetical protein
MKELGFEGCGFHLYESKTIRVVSLPDERSKLNGLFRPKRACYILILLNIFLFLFSFLRNKKIITI